MDNKYITNESEPEIILVPQGDVQMEAAIDMARATVHVFLQALESPTVDQSGFAVKAAFPVTYNQSFEHLWLANISYDGSVLHGEVWNEPQDVRHLRAGNHVTVAPQDISDWMFIHKGKLVSGYTVRVLYGHLSAEEREHFCAQMGFKIE